MKKQKLSIQKLQVQSFVTNADAIETKGGATYTCKPVGGSDTSCIYNCPDVYTYCCDDSVQVCEA